MTTAEAAPPPKVQEAGDIPLEDLDKILETEDPEFTKSLEEVRAVESATDVVIEASVVTEDEMPAGAHKPETRFAKIRSRLQLSVFRIKHNAKTRLKTLGAATLIFLKTKPKEFFFYAIAIAKVLLRKAMIPLTAFGAANRQQKLICLVFVGLIFGAGWVLLHNMRGVWLPRLNEPLLTSLADQADEVETFDPKEGFESFYTAFPQERYEFLFDRFKVNLRATRENPNPMGALEIIVLLDSKDTAIEVGDRKVEFFDGLQRVLEDEIYADLATEEGKNKLKGKLKHDLNEKLTQGWVKDINYKTFVLKP